MTSDRDDDAEDTREVISYVNDLACLLFGEGTRVEVLVEIKTKAVTMTDGTNSFHCVASAGREAFDLKVAEIASNAVARLN